MAVLAAGGCAKSPGGTNTGPSLIVTLTFKGAINPAYFYYFVIRNADEQNPRNWPVAVIMPAAGNGFATDGASGESEAAFTDFVLYTQGQGTASGYALYHVSGGLHGNPNLATSFLEEGDPDNAVPPGAIDPYTLRFQIALSRLLPPSGECNPATASCPQARYLQVNAISTTTRPVDPQSFGGKYTDAFGDQRQGSGTQNLAVTVDTTSANLYQSSPNSGDEYYEPDGDAQPPGGDPAIELTGWRVEVRR